MAGNKVQEYLQKQKPYTKGISDDINLGRLFAKAYKDLCRYNVTAKQWYFYNGKVWVEDTGGMQISQCAKDFTEQLMIYCISIEDKQESAELFKLAYKLTQLRRREFMIRDSQNEWFISNDMLDKDLFIFNCQNGTLNLKTFEFKPHNADDLLSKISNVVFDETAASPLFEKFIDEVMEGNSAKVEYMQKILGYSLTGETRLETMFILYGATTRNGKSTLVETHAYMLGNSTGYAFNTKPETLAQRQNNDSRQASGDIARLKGCRFLNASEPPKRMMFDTGLLKTLLGRDTITARHLHEREFEFVPEFKLFMNTNHLPLISDDTLFTSKRINVIKFNKHFSPGEQDKTLKDKLKTSENISGLFNWCIAGLKKFYEVGAEPPIAVEIDTEEYQTNSDKLGNFMSECLETSSHNSKALDVYKKYQSWCVDNGYGAENKSNFFADLRAKNILDNTGTVSGATVKNVVRGYIIINDEQLDTYQGETPQFKSNRKPHNYN